MISTVAGSNGTVVSTEPLMALVTQADSALQVASVYWLVAGLNELVNNDAGGQPAGIHDCDLGAG